MSILKFLYSTCEWMPKILSVIGSPSADQNEDPTNRACAEKHLRLHDGLVTGASPAETRNGFGLNSLNCSAQP
ncbi:unnamed protein product [Protopolystoma xenopodis]|uniref:Uncharacterized protein n=1 Tax=Protopolystoma xenopodis TaxID=117903 RepID=A0A3S5CN12_9PLAT|nr:unnamed protein product [Protopolystoma xenopodis]